MTFKSRNSCQSSALPIRSQSTLSVTPENIRKPYDFLMFSGGRKRVHWERIGYSWIKLIDFE